MNTQRIYFQKFDELETMLGLKPVERPSTARQVADRVAAEASTLLKLARRDGTRRTETAPAAS